MKRILLFIFISSLTVSSLYSQNNRIRAYVENGFTYYESNDYDNAIVQFTKALEISNKEIDAHYGLMLAYYYSGSYKFAIKHAEIVAKSKSNYASQAFVTLGSSYNLLKDRKNAYKAFNQGIKKFPDNHLLYFNLAYSAWEINDFKTAEASLEKSLRLKPNHSTSHLLLSYCMSDQKKRSQAIMACVNFLILEPVGDRAVSASKFLNNLFFGGISVNKEDSTKISINVNFDPSVKSEFSGAEILLTILAATKFNDENKDKSDVEFLEEMLSTLINVVSDEGKRKGFWSNFYVDFYDDLKEKGHLTALAYFISQSTSDEGVNEWMASNSNKLEEFSRWYKFYKRKF